MSASLQGINTKVYEVETDKLISRSWAAEIARLRGQAPFAARVSIRMLPGEDHLSQRHQVRYRDGLLRLRKAGIQRCFVLLGWEFMPARSDSGSPDDPLDAADWSNNYVREFTRRAADFAQLLATSGAAEDFIIWNEPNQAEPLLPLANFAALLWHCWDAIRAIGRVYMGGIYLNQDRLDKGLAYLNGVYQAFRQNGKAETDSWPWSGINLHMHGDWRDKAIAQAWSTHRNAIERLKTKWGDSSETIVGEWGLSEQMYSKAPNGIEHMHNVLRSRTDAMFFFTLDAFQEGANTWGLYDWTSEGPELVLTGKRKTHAAYQHALDGQGRS